MRLIPLLLPAVSLLLLACGQEGITSSSTTTTGAGMSTGTTTGGTGGGTGTALKVLDWNTRNFYDAIDDPALQNDNGTDSGEQIKTQAQYDQQREAIAAVIAGFDPDVIVFAEVENEGVLADLNADLGGKYVALEVPEGNDARGLDVAAMSKIPFDQVVTHKEDMFVLEGTNAPTYRFSRNVPEFHLTVGGRKVVLLGVHYRSKGPPDDADKRLAEAQRTRAIANGLTAADADLGAIILGDTNDLPGSYPLQALVGAEPDVYKDAPDAIPSADRWTYDYMGAFELIDHQLSNPVLAPMLDEGSVAIPHSAQIDEIGDHSPIFAAYDIVAP
jgi:predicted extracellular nuclease